MERIAHSFRRPFQLPIANFSVGPELRWCTVGYPDHLPGPATFDFVDQVGPGDATGLSRSTHGQCRTGKEHKASSQRRIPSEQLMGSHMQLRDCSELVPYESITNQAAQVALFPLLSPVPFWMGTTQIVHGARSAFGASTRLASSSSSTFSATGSQRSLRPTAIAASPKWDSDATRCPPSASYWG